VVLLRLRKSYLCSARNPKEVALLFAFGLGVRFWASIDFYDLLVVVPVSRVSSGILGDLEQPFPSIGIR